MKVIVCEICNGHDFAKQDDMYICGSCGTKYSVEEVKKMMVDVDTDNKKLSNLYERARKSLEVDDLEHAAEYYKQILDEKPNDWEAYFYSYLGEFTSFTNAQAAGVAEKLGKTLPPSYDMAIDGASPEEIGRRVMLICEQTANRLTNIALTGSALLRQYEGGNLFSPAGKVHCDLYKNLRPVGQSTIVNAVLAFDPLKEKLEELFRMGRIPQELMRNGLLTLLRAQYNIANFTFSPVAGSTEKMIKDEIIMGYAQRIHAMDPTFIMPTPPQQKASGGCYVATAVYGSYDCPEVWTLRRYRDDTLAATWYGRAFIRTYYAVSPTLVKWFGKTDRFKNLWKPTLDRMVAKLQSRGVESTPYEDRSW